jgi:hypothetical protein
LTTAREIDDEEASNVSIDEPVVDIASAKIGDLVEFGSYYQESADYQTPVKWRVLEVDNDNVLLLSDTVLLPLRMGDKSETADITWDNSSIRSWLNDYFLSTVFSGNEQSSLDVIYIDGSVDRVTLLSKAEFAEYVDDEWAAADVSQYAQDFGMIVANDGKANGWWLRDNYYSSSSDNLFYFVYSDGSLCQGGLSAEKSGVGVRPAVWVNVSGSPVVYDATSSGEFTKSSQSYSEVISSSTTSTQNSLADKSVVSFSTTTTTGEFLTGSVNRSASGYVIEDSSTRTYTKQELQALGLSAAELCIARNEIYARLGYHFENTGLQAYFGACPWYSDSGSKPEPSVGSAGYENALLLREIESEQSDSAKWLQLSQG